MCENQEMLGKKNFSIELIRVVAMFMIIFDHILSKVSFPMQAIVVQVSNSGVFIFLLISGFLYGNKNIDNWKNWFINRILKICIPMWLFMVVDFIVEAILWNNFDIKYVFIYAFNLQGILGVNIGGTNLWFLTLIMICYLTTPVLQWIKEKSLGRNVGIIVLIAAIVAQIILAYTTDIGMVAGHTLSWCVFAVGMYVTGYFAGNIILSDYMGRTRIIAISMLTVIVSGIVFFFNIKFDGRIIYDRIVAYYGMIVIDLWISTVLYKLGQYIKDGMIRNIVNHLDAISYEFYIVHGLLIAAVTVNVLDKWGAITYILSTLMLSWMVAVVFHWIISGIKIHEQK